MKRFVICLLFLFTVVWSWNTTVDYFGPENLVAEKMTGSDDKVVQKLDEVISALMEANHFTNLSVQPTLSFTSNIARRYRPGGFTFDKSFKNNFLFLAGICGQAKICRLLYLFPA